MRVGFRSDFDVSPDRHVGFQEKLLLSLSARLFGDEHPFSTFSGMEVFVHDPLKTFIGMSSFRPFPEH